MLMQSIVNAFSCSLSLYLMITEKEEPILPNLFATALDFEIEIMGTCIVQPLRCSSSQR